MSLYETFPQFVIISREYGNLYAYRRWEEMQADVPELERLNPGEIWENVDIREGDNHEAQLVRVEGERGLYLFVIQNGDVPRLPVRQYYWIGSFAYGRRVTDVEFAGDREPPAAG